MPVSPGACAPSSSSMWTVRVWLESTSAVVGEPAGARFGTEAAAIRWAIAELARLRTSEGNRLGGEQCLAYAARIRGPGTRRTAYLFSEWEPIEWDDLSGSARPDTPERSTRARYDLKGT